MKEKNTKGKSNTNKNSNRCFYDLNVACRAL